MQFDGDGVLGALEIRRKLLKQLIRTSTRSGTSLKRGVNESKAKKEAARMSGFSEVD
jgi:hypothetical protein